MAQLSISRGPTLEGIFYLPDRPVVIGRADGVDIQLLDSSVSRRHAVIRQSVAGFMIQDLSTKNGTYVNKEAVEKSLLFHGDSVSLGSYTLHFLEDASVGGDDAPQKLSLMGNLGERSGANVKRRSEAETAAFSAVSQKRRTDSLMAVPGPDPVAPRPSHPSRSQSTTAARLRAAGASQRRPRAASSPGELSHGTPGMPPPRPRRGGGSSGPATNPNVTPFRGKEARSSRRRSTASLDLSFEELELILDDASSL